MRSFLSPAAVSPSLSCSPTHIYTQGEWNVFEDACPHRLAALSEGRIDENTGNLMCTYHGWTFDSAGKCTKIPQSSPKEMKSESCMAVILKLVP